MIYKQTFMDIIIQTIRESVMLNVVIWIALVVFIFILLREIVLWYWKINENTNSLRSIAESLDVIANVMTSKSEEEVEEPSLMNSREWKAANMESKDDVQFEVNDVK